MTVIVIIWAVISLAAILSALDKRRAPVYRLLAGFGGAFSLVLIAFFILAATN